MSIQEKEGLSRTQQLNALRDLHKLEKIKRSRSISQNNDPSEPDPLNSPGKSAQPSQPTNQKSLENPQGGPLPSLNPPQSSSIAPPSNSNPRTVQKASNQSVKQSETQLNAGITEEREKNANYANLANNSSGQFFNQKNRSPNRAKKRDISITLSAYNAQLKKAEDKEFFKMREEFSRALAKLESIDTRELGIQEGQRLISKNRTPRTVRLVFSMLQSRTNISCPQSKEAEMLLLGHLAKIFGNKLCDSLDNPPSFTKAVFRMMDLMIGYFK